MYDEEYIVGSYGDGNYLSVVPGYLSVLDSENIESEEETENDGIRSETDSESESESELESESESELEESGSSEGNDNTVIDYTEILNDIQSNLEDIETIQLSLVNNFETLETEIGMIENVTFYTFYLFVACFIGLVFIIIYNWLNNFIK